MTEIDPTRGDLISAGDIARVFGVNPKTVSRWANNGKLPAAFRTPGGHRRWLRSDVERALRGEAA